MVESVADRLRQLMEREQLSYEKFGAIAGVSAQAVQKWMKGGKIKSENVEPIARYFRVSPAWILYGQHEIAGTHDGDLSSLALDVARRWQDLSSERQDSFRDLIFTMHFIENRFPAMRKGRPKGESYDKLEAAFERDMRQLRLKLE